MISGWCQTSSKHHPDFLLQILSNIIHWMMFEYYTNHWMIFEMPSKHHPDSKSKHHPMDGIWFSSGWCLDFFLKFLKLDDIWMMSDWYLDLNCFVGEIWPGRGLSAKKIYFVTKISLLWRLCDTNESICCFYPYNARL